MKYNNIFKKIISSACAAAIVASGALNVNAAIEDTGFTDVDADNVYADAIAYCVDNGIIRRTGVTEFSPDETMNRELAACILFRLEGSPSGAEGVSFDDVSVGRWFQTGVYWAAANNIFNGYGDGRFGVNDSITEEQFLTALWRYAGSPQVSGETNPNVSEWAAEAALWAEQNNIAADISPSNPVTRGQAAEYITNFLAVYETPYMTNGENQISSSVEEAEFVEKVRMTVEGVEGEAIVSLIDSKPTREFIAQLPMTVTFSDFGDREKFGAMPQALSEDEALLSGYEIGDFSYGTPYDSMIMFYAQDNEIIDGIIKLGTFDSGLELFTGDDPINVTIEVVEE